MSWMAFTMLSPSVKMVRLLDALRGLLTDAGQFTSQISRQRGIVRKYTRAIYAHMIPATSRQDARDRGSRVANLTTKT